MHLIVFYDAQVLTPDQRKHIHGLYRHGKRTNVVVRGVDVTTNARALTTYSVNSLPCVCKVGERRVVHYDGALEDTERLKMFCDRAPSSLILFVRENCWACEALHPQLGALASTLREHDVEMRKVDAGASPQLLEHYGATTVPAFVAERYDGSFALYGGTDYAAETILDFVLVSEDLKTTLLETPHFEHEDPKVEDPVAPPVPASPPVEDGEADANFPRVLYFSMDGCRHCEAAAEAVRQARNVIRPVPLLHIEIGQPGSEALFDKHAVRQVPRIFLELSPSAAVELGAPLTSEGIVGQVREKLGLVADGGVPKRLSPIPPVSASLECQMRAPLYAKSQQWNATILCLCIGDSPPSFLDAVWREWHRVTHVQDTTKRCIWVHAHSLDSITPTPNVTYVTPDLGPRLGLSSADLQSLSGQGASKIQEVLLRLKHFATNKRGR